MIFTFEYISKDENIPILDEKIRETINKGLSLFSEYYLQLWF